MTTVEVLNLRKSKCEAATWKNAFVSRLIGKILAGVNTPINFAALNAAPTII